MPRLVSLLLPGAAVLAVLAPCSVASADEGVMSPISLGVMGNRDFQAATVGFGIGPHDEKVSLLFHGRAAVGPVLSAGMGGVTGGYDFIDGEHVQFGVNLGVSMGGGRFRGSSTGLLAAAEPGLFLRLLSEKIGAVHFDAGWYQPVYVREGGVGGAAMLSIAWSPFFDD